MSRPGRHRRPPDVLDLERGRWPWSRGYRLARRPADAGLGRPWWVRLGAAAPWRAEVTLALAAGLCAAVGALGLWFWARG